MSVHRFVVHRNRLTGRWRFNLIDRNNEVISVSQRYKSQAACTRGIAAVREAAPLAEVIYK